MTLPLKTRIRLKVLTFKAKLGAKYRNFRYRITKLYGRYCEWQIGRREIIAWVPKYQTHEMQLQEWCSHLKGGQHGKRRRHFGVRDYAITDHTFIDGSRRVWCQLCRKTWIPGTWGWKRDVPEMLANTTNGATSSQVVIPNNGEWQSSKPGPRYQYKSVPFPTKPILTAPLDQVWKNRLRVLYEAIKIMTQGA